MSAPNRLRTERGSFLRVTLVVVTTSVIGVVALFAALIAFRPDRRQESTSKAPLVEARDLAAEAGRAGDPMSCPEKAVVRIHGRVIDERRRPVAGARVSIGQGVDGFSGPSVTSAVDGLFSISIPSAAEFDLVAVMARSENSVGVREVRVWSGGPKASADAVVLRKAVPVRVIVTREGESVAQAQVFLEAEGTRSVVQSARADADGVAKFDSLPQGVYRVVAKTLTDEGRSRVFLPEQGEVRVELQPLRSYEVRVSDVATEAGMPGVEVRMYERHLALANGDQDATAFGGYMETWWSPQTWETDAEGIARMEGISAVARPGITARAEGYTASDIVRPVELLDEPRVELSLRASVTKTVRWPVVSGEVPVPEDGSSIKVRYWDWSSFRDPPPLDHARMEGSSLVLPRVTEPGRFVASLGDGRVADLSIDPRAFEASGEGDVLCLPVSFSWARALTVYVKDWDGRPVEGAVVTVCDPSGMTLCEPGRSGEGGAAVLLVFNGGLAEVTVRASEFGWLVKPKSFVGSVDLAVDSSVIATFRRPWSGRIAMTCDGEARLPSVYWVKIREWHRILSEDLERGEVSVEIRRDAGSTVPFTVFAEGYIPASGTLVVSDWSELRGEVALRTGGWYEVEVRSDLKTHVPISIEQMDPKTESFGSLSNRVGIATLSEPNAPENRFRFGPLEDGVYRAVASSLGVGTEPATVVRGAIVTRSLDIPTPQWVSGRVEVPEGVDHGEVHVGVRDFPQRDPGSGVSVRSRSVVRSDGTFRIQIPGDRRVQVSPSHHRFEPALDGSVVTTLGRDDVVLRFTPATEVQIWAPDLADLKLRGLRVGYWRGVAAGAPDRWIRADLFLRGIHFAAPESGECALVIDPGAGFAPEMLFDVALRDGMTTLGPVEFSTGTTLQVRILTPADTDPPSIHVGASRIGDMNYSRQVTSDGSRVVELAGLGAGNFRVSISSLTDPARRDEREIEVDGVSDVEVVYDLR